jgi:hypothetical protein
MGNIQPQSYESLVKMDHFQNERPLNSKGSTGAPEGRMSAKVCLVGLLDSVVVRRTASYTHADGFYCTAVRNPNTRTALLTFAVE